VRCTFLRKRDAGLRAKHLAGPGRCRFLLPRGLPQARKHRQAGGSAPWPQPGIAAIEAAQSAAVSALIFPFNWPRPSGFPALV